MAAQILVPPSHGASQELSALALLLVLYVLSTKSAAPSRLSLLAHTPSPIPSRSPSANAEARCALNVYGEPKLEQDRRAACILDAHRSRPLLHLTCPPPLSRCDRHYIQSCPKLHNYSYRCCEPQESGFLPLREYSLRVSERCGALDMDRDRSRGGGLGEQRQATMTPARSNRQWGSELLESMP